MYTKYTSNTIHSKNFGKDVWGWWVCLQKPLGWLSSLRNSFRVCLGQKYNVVFKMTDGFQAYEKLYS